NKRAKHALDSSYLWHCHLCHINKKRLDKLQRDGILQPTHNESLEKYKSCISGKMARKSFSHQVERDKDLLGLIHTDNLTTLPKSFWGYALKSTAGIFNMVPTKKVERTPYKIWHGKALKLSYLRFWGSSGSHGLLDSSGSDGGLELIQEEDTQPFENTSKIHNEVAPIEVEPQNVKVPIHRTARIPQAPDRYGFYTAVKDILKYLRNTKDMVLVYGAKPEEAEYIAVAESSMKAVLMRKFIDGLGSVVPLNKRPMEMLCDNESAIVIANDLGILKGAREPGIFKGNIVYHYILKGANDPGIFKGARHS
nr:retrotransposon protein, putative, Ty1-copia subclass [Tanacetum cinerariifolium]